MQTSAAYDEPPDGFVTGTRVPLQGIGCLWPRAPSLRSHVLLLSLTCPRQGHQRRFHRRGCDFFSTASPRAVLAELAAAAADAESADQSAAFLRSQPEPIIVRPLRRIDLRAIVRLYEQNIAGQSGWPLRGEAYWEWLLARG